MMDAQIDNETIDKKEELNKAEVKETEIKAIEVEDSIDSSIIKEIKNKITEGYQAIHAEDEVILVIGNTGSGKSTLVNYLAGARLIAEKKGFGKLLIAVPEPISSEMRVSHKLKSETAIPNSWKDNNTGIVYWDCPGFDDNRGPVQDIANAFYIKRLFELSKQVKIIVVTTESSFTEGRGTEFTSLIGSLANLFVDVEHFKESLSLIVTKATEGSEVSDVTGAIQEILTTEDTAVTKDSNQQKVLQYLAEHDNQIGLFYAPKKAGEITGNNRSELLSVIENTKPVRDFAVSISVSDKSKLYVSDLINEINDQIYNDILQYCKELNKKASNLPKDVYIHQLAKSVAPILELQKIGQKVLIMVSDMRISADQFIKKLKGLEIVGENLINKITENIEYLGFCKEISTSTRTVYFTNSWLSPWQNLDNKINSKGGYIDSLSGYLKSTIYKNLDEAMQQFAIVINDKFVMLSNSDENDINKYLHLKEYVKNFKEVNWAEIEIEYLCDYFDSNLISRFDVETDFTLTLRQHLSILHLLGIDELNQYTNHLGLYLMQIDLQKSYEEVINDLSHSTIIRFNSYIEEFTKKFISKFSNSTPQIIFESVRILKSVCDGMMHDSNCSIDEIITVLQNVPEISQELEFAKSEFLKLKTLFENNVEVRLIDGNDFIKQLVSFNERVENIYNNYSQRKSEESNKKLGNLIQAFTLKVLKKYYELSEKDKDSKLSLLKIFEENLEVSAKGNLVHSIENIKSSLGNLIESEEISQIEDIIEESNYLSDPSMVLSQSEWSGQIKLLIEQIQNDVQKDLEVEEAKNSIKVLLDAIESSINTIAEKSSDVGVINDRLTKLSSALEGIISIIPDKTAGEFVEIIKTKVDEQYLKMRKAVLKQYFNTINNAKNLIIDATILADFKALSHKIDEAIDWYETLPKIYQAITSPGYILESKIKPFNTINAKNFKGFLKQFLEFETDFVYSANKANELNSLIEAASKSNLSIKSEDEHKVLSVKGDCIKVSDIQPHITNKTKAIKVKSFGSIIFDTNLVAKGASIVIIAPKWVVNKDVVIDLSGQNALIHTTVKASDGHGYVNKTRNGQDGSDGLTGLPGENGGHFYGIGEEFIGLDKLLVNVNGGQGGDGQIGGNGSHGQDNNRHAGKAPNSYSKKEVFNKSGTIWKYWYLKNKGYDDCSFHYDKMELYHGFPGGKGGNGGKGGAGGYGGFKGTVELYCGDQLKEIGFVAREGVKGMDGAVGVGGAGGKDSNNTEIFLGYAPEAPRVREAKYTRKNLDKYGPDGIRPKEKAGYDEIVFKETKEWFEMLVYETKKEYIIILQNDDSNKFFVKIQKTCLKDFCQHLSLEPQKNLSAVNLLQKNIEELEYKAAEQKQISFTEMVKDNPMYSNRYAVLSLEDSNDGWGEMDVTGSSEW